MKNLSFIILFSFLFFMLGLQMNNSEMRSTEKSLLIKGVRLDLISEKNLSDADSIKAVILSKIIVPKTKNTDNQFILTYKNKDGEIWKIEDALKFWNVADKNDSIMVYYHLTKKLDGVDVRFINIKKI